MADIEQFYLSKIAVDSPADDDIRQFVETLWDDCSRSIFVFVHRRIRDKDVAADICQDVFVKVMKSLHKSANRRRDDLNFPAWVQRIARNLVMDYFRKVGRVEYGLEPDKTFDSDRPSSVGPVAHESPPIPEMLSREQELSILRECIESLDHDDRCFVTLIDIQGQAQNFVAQRFSLSTATMFRRINAARARLRQCFSSRLELTTSSLG